MINKVFRTLGMFLVMTSPIHAEEIKYVTDVLLLSLHEQEGSQGELLKKLPSGTRLEVLGESGLFSRVRTEEGVEGWTKSGFLTSEMPASARLLEMEARTEKLSRELEQSQAALKAEQTRIVQLQEAQQRNQDERSNHEQSSLQTARLIKQLREENRQYKNAAGNSEAMIPQRWAMIAAPVILILGFIAGVSWFDYRSRKRHGGYRIY